MLRRSTVGAALLTIAAAAPALAQTDAMAMMHTTAANQLGVLEYCQAQGYVGADAVAAQQAAIAKLPPTSVSTADAEALGKQGSLAVPNGTPMTLASLASTHNVTVSSMCQQMGSSAVQAGAMMQQNGMGGGMPQMPPGMTSGMPAMPAMPGGMPTMGTMPAMPAMPGTAPAR